MDTFACGHPRTPDNIEAEHGKRPQVRCRACRLARRKRQRAAARDRQPLCPSGRHPWPSNKRIDSGGRAYCAECVIERTTTANATKATAKQYALLLQAQRAGADITWMDRGLCADMDSRMFCVDDHGRADPQAVAVCFRCPVQQQCLDYALHFREWDLWGGTTDKQREALRAREGAA